MSYKVVAIPPFDRQLKRLAKKFPSLKEEIGQLLSILQTNPQYGVCIGHECYKVRLSISSKGKGKRAGGRIITTFVVEEEVVYLLAIYDKSEKDDITDQELLKLLNRIDQ